MKENRFTFFEENLSRIPAFKDGDLYRLEEGRWIHNKGGSEEGSPSRALAGQLLSDKRIVKLDGTKRAFLSTSRDIVAVIDLPRQSRETTLENHLKRFDECFNTASTSYHAYYDELTGVLNRRGITYYLQTAFQKPQKIDGQSESLTKQISGGADIVLFAFDIDRFKSVNDTYGHDVGDIVLASFASRLNSHISILNKKYHSKFIFGRPGGEEFELIAIGSFSARDRRTVEDLLLSEIRKEFKPEGNGSDLAFKNAKKIQFPTIVTASIGVSSSKVPVNQEKISETLLGLRKEADTALYRAKADGRNCIRTYSDIRLKHGRVTEYYEDSQLVQVDIGSEVGVKPGQNYTVHFPPFTGAEVVRDSGSGTRVLGTYPMVVSAKIKIIEVNNDVSTAILLERSGTVNIPIGSRLRYFFTGSLTILSPQSSYIGAVTQNAVEIVGHIDGLMKDGAAFSIISFDGDLRPEDGRSESVILEEVYSLMHIMLPSGSRIFHSRGGRGYIVTRNDKDVNARIVDDYITPIITKTEKLGIKLNAGICQPNSLPPQASRTAEALLFYANSALKSLDDSDDKSVIFGEWTPLDTINAWRKEWELEHALADYQNFRRFGFDSSRLDNHLGLTIVEADAVERFSIAEIAFSRAAETDTSEPMFRANLAVLQALRGRFNDAFENFSGIVDFIDTQGDVYLLAFTKSFLMYDGEDVDTTNFQKLELLSKALGAFEEPPSRPPLDSWWQEIKAELDSIERKV